MLLFNSELLRLFFQPFKNFSQKTRLKFTFFLSPKYWCLPLLCISIVIFQFDHHRVCFLRLLSTICSSFTDRGCRASSHFNATYITFLLFPIYINRILASHFPYTRIFKANEPSPTLLPPFALSGLYSLLTRCSLELPPK